MFTTGYLKTLINMDLFKGIRQGRLVLQEWIMNSGIIAMQEKKPQRQFIRAECAWKSILIHWISGGIDE